MVLRYGFCYILEHNSFAGSGGAMTKARWPFPIGDIRSITRQVDPPVWCLAFPFLSEVACLDTKVSSYQSLSYAGQHQALQNLFG